MSKSGVSFIQHRTVRHLKQLPIVCLKGRPRKGGIPLSRLDFGVTTGEGLEGTTPDTRREKKPLEKGTSRHLDFMYVLNVFLKQSKRKLSKTTNFSTSLPPTTSQFLRQHLFSLSGTWTLSCRFLRTWYVTTSSRPPSQDERKDDPTVSFYF